MIRRPIVVVGSIAYDRIFDFPGRFAEVILPEKVHLLNVSFTVDQIQESFGGTAGNIAYTLRLFGVPTALVGSVGHDFAAYRVKLSRQRVDLGAVQTVSGRATAAAYMITDRDDNQISAFQLGALAVPAVAQAAARHRLRRAAYAVLSPGNPKDMVLAAQQLVRFRVPYLFDPGQTLPVLSAAQLRALVRQADGFISNDYELDLMIKRSGWPRSRLEKLVRYLVTTFGAKGSVVRHGSHQIHIPIARPRAIVDPTGAGDAYRAGLIAGLVSGQSLITAAKMGAVASVYTVERRGTQTHRFSRSEFSKRFRANFRQPLTLGSKGFS
ncbi:MAG: carbohydrate kinase family protein [Candidatus Kerfeldbacteria bacterium]|nr:carbohydrate kinase family protein [Candidatus Kerfeldbacteria bacterium]